MRDPVTTKAANRALGPLVKFIHKNRGARGDVLKRLNKRTRKKWNRENIERWLNEDDKKRTQPLFGVGLLLVEIGDEMIQEDNGK